jgi:hypothetical protein
LLGIVVIIVALLNFLHIRGAIDAETFHPPTRFAILLTVLICRFSPINATNKKGLHFMVHMLMLRRARLSPNLIALA